MDQSKTNATILLLNSEALGRKVVAEALERAGVCSACGR